MCTDHLYTYSPTALICGGGVGFLSVFASGGGRDAVGWGSLCTVHNRSALAASGGALTGCRFSQAPPFAPVCSRPSLRLLPISPHNAGGGCLSRSHMIRGAVPRIMGATLDLYGLLPRCRVSIVATYGEGGSGRGAVRLSLLTVQSEDTTAVLHQVALLWFYAGGGRGV